MLKSNEREAYNQLLSFMERLPHKCLKVLIKESRSQLANRYPRNHRRRKRGNIDPSYNDQEYQRLLKHCENKKAQLAIKVMHKLGTRIGETVPIKIEHIDFLQRLLYLHTEKSNTEDVLPLHDEIYYDLRDWVNQHHRAIMQHNGYLFFSDNPVQRRQHISKDWLRVYYAKIREAAGLAQVYGYSTERNGRKPRRLFIKTPHSGRHTFGTYMWRITGDPKIVQLALRQQDLKSTEPYIHVQTQEVHRAIMQGFRKPVALLHEVH